MLLALAWLSAAAVALPEARLQACASVSACVAAADSDAAADRASAIGTADAGDTDPGRAPLLPDPASESGSSGDGAWPMSRTLASTPRCGSACSPTATDAAGHGPRAGLRPPAHAPPSDA